MTRQRALIYFADPMCSWCWGFAPTITRIYEIHREQLPFRLVLGGLYPAPGNTLTEASRQSIREHWDHVRSAAGTSFNYEFFDRSNFVYNTEPPSRAVVAAGTLDEPSSLIYLERLQHAFYVENTDITQKEEQVKLAVEHGFEREAFVAVLESDACQREVETHFEVTRNAEVRGLPTLIGVQGEDITKISCGYTSEEQVLTGIITWLSRNQHYSFH